MDIKIISLIISAFLFAPLQLLSQQAEADAYAKMRGLEFLEDTSHTVDIYLYGITSQQLEALEKDILPNVTITMVDLYGEATQISSSEDLAFYTLQLKFDNKYKIYFEYSDMYTKYLEIDTRDVIDIDQEVGYLFPTDVTMIPAADFDVKALYLKKPVGKAYYDRRLQMFTWDMNYTDKLNAEVEKIKKKKKKR
ncbi:hypothetical protein G3O08_10385 [Cryomorpha ignava]|uniref:Uncharacterized protein n=1 Tax=Cryomorpha ignava TaxID=101383 RepID=A0A7K3WQV8_9FLAO|nr:hypothetical protein [Cryomorpha ignava]NEN23906.1 hypothetical protein [Cryomorpha ignava]